MVLTFVLSHPPTVVICVLYAVLVVFPLFAVVHVFRGVVRMNVCDRASGLRYACNPGLVAVFPSDPCHFAYAYLWSVLGVWSTLQVIWLCRFVVLQ